VKTRAQADGEFNDSAPSPMMGPAVPSPKQIIATAVSKGHLPKPKHPMTPRDMLSKRQRTMRDRSTKGSPPIVHHEFSRGYRSIG
jgi:hypothetical protein